MVRNNAYILQKNMNNPYTTQVKVATLAYAAPSI